MKLTKYVAMAIAACCAFTAVADEGDIALGAYAGTVFKSGYLSNGTLIYDDWVFQSYAGVTLGNDAMGTFDFNFWNSCPAKESHYSKCAASEIDWELDYGIKLGDYKFGCGVATWTYPNTGDWDDEWVAKVSVAYTGCEAVTPEVNARFGLESQQGCYGQFKLSKGFALGQDTGLSADIYGLVGYASKSWRAGKGDDSNGFVDFECGAKVTYEICSFASICAGCQYSVIIDSTLRDNIDDVDEEGNAAFWQDDGEKDHFLYYAGADIWF